MDENLLARGIAAVKAGNKQEAHRLLDAATREAPNDERTWGWFYNVCENDGERIHCLRELLRINPNNETATKKLNELISSDPLFTSPTPILDNPTPLGQPAKEGEDKGLPTWEKILLSVLVVIAAIVVCSLVILIFNPQLNNAFEKIKADIYGTPTPTFSVFPIGSDLNYQNWSIHIDRIETKHSIQFTASPDYPTKGRFAILHLTVTNTGDTTVYFLPSLETAIFDAETYYMCDFVLSSEESVLEGIAPQEEIGPHQTGLILAVYDISSSSESYLLGIPLKNTGVLLNMP